MSTSSFADLGLCDALLRATADNGYSQPTPIQAQAIPVVLQGRDVLAAAQTGTGKTAGFTLPLLQRLTQTPQRAGAGKPGRPRALVLTPTRELAAQVEECVRSYARYLPIKSMVMFGGVGMQPQIDTLRRHVDILVACPGRLLDHVGQRTLDLSGIEILVLDEADRMLDMGFIRDIRKILALLPGQRQNLLFSATFSDDIRQLADGLLDNPTMIEVAARNTTAERVEQGVYMVAQQHKREALAHLIQQNAWPQVLVFTRTKHGANKLAEFLEKHAIPAAAIHGNKSQSARTRALAQFKDGSLPVLVATDIAARGLDIDELPQVVNFELPNVPEDYVHRIGRTGRAGASGAAVSLVDGEEVKLLKGIERLIKRPIPRYELQNFTPAVSTVAPREEPQNRGEHRAPGGHRGKAGKPSQPRRSAEGDKRPASSHAPQKRPQTTAGEPRTAPANTRPAGNNGRAALFSPRSPAAKPGNR